MKEFERFGDLSEKMVRAFAERLNPIEWETLVDHFEGKGRKLPKITEGERFHWDILWHFHEVETSFNNLQYIPLFINSYRSSKNYRKARITGIVYLGYHIDHYLEENYILMNRVKTFLVRLSRMLKKKGRVREVAIVSELKDIFINSMSDLGMVRGEHVHQKRHQDHDLFMAEFAKVNYTETHDRKFMIYSNRIYKSARIKWIELITKNNQELKKLLDYTFGHLIPIVFTPEISIDSH
jgi:hypothetical protein